MWRKWLSFRCDLPGLVDVSSPMKTGITFGLDGSDCGMCPDVQCTKIEGDTLLCMALDTANCCIDYMNVTDKHRCVYGMF